MALDLARLQAGATAQAELFRLLKPMVADVLLTLELTSSNSEAAQCVFEQHTPAERIQLLALLRTTLNNVLTAWQIELLLEQAEAQRITTKTLS